MTRSSNIDKYCIYLNKKGIEYIAGINGTMPASISPIPQREKDISVDRLARLVDLSVQYFLSSPRTSEEMQFILAQQLNRGTRKYLDHRFLSEKNKLGVRSKEEDKFVVIYKGVNPERSLNPFYTLRLARDKEFQKLYARQINSGNKNK
ncbi:MAG: hypothetical protein Q7S56_03190 [Nanoarchaeota archaeon]|nr:hypothetical protein [Nanoarchaeota archaeon]